MKWHQHQLTTAPVSSPTCSYRTSSPLEKSQPSISRMPARGTYKSPKGVWQPVTTPSATSPFLRQLPLVSSGRNHSAASADGAPQGYAHAQIQPAEPTPPSRRGSCLGSHASERPHTTNTQKKCMDKYTGTSVTGIQLSGSTKRPSSWLELFRPQEMLFLILRPMSLLQSKSERVQMPWRFVGCDTAKCGVRHHFKSREDVSSINA